MSPYVFVAQKHGVVEIYKAGYELDEEMRKFLRKRWEIANCVKGQGFVVNYVLSSNLVRKIRKVSHVFQFKALTSEIQKAIVGKTF